MKPGWLAEENFNASAALTGVTLLSAMALAWAAGPMYQTPRGRSLAELIQVARSRVVLYNPGVTGYYEQLLESRDVAIDRGAKVTILPDRIWDRSFRLFRFLPNLKDVHATTQPQGITTNSFGHLGPEWSLQKSPGTRRIAILGDSLTQGWGSNQSQSYVMQLNARLNAGNGGSRFETLNFAVTGYELTQILDVAEEDVPQFHPDVYVLALTELMSARTWDEHLVRMVRLRIDPKYDFVRVLTREAKVSPEDSSLELFAEFAPYRMQFLRTVLSRLKERAAKDGAIFMAFLVPCLEDGEMSQKRLSEMPGLLKSLDIPFVDASGAFENTFDLESLRINPFDVHPNAHGHAMLSKAIYSGLHSSPSLWRFFAGADQTR